MPSIDTFKRLAERAAERNSDPDREKRGVMTAYGDAAAGCTLNIAAHAQRLFCIVCIQVIAEREAAIVEALAGQECIGPSGYTPCNIPFEGSISFLVGPHTIDVGSTVRVGVHNRSNASNRITAVWYNYSPFVHAQAPGQPTIVDALQAQQAALDALARGFNERLDTIEKNSRYGSSAEAAQAHAREALQAQQERMLSHNSPAAGRPDCYPAPVPAPSPKPQPTSDDNEWHAWATPCDES
jgi:hypothetical protein